MSPGLTVLLFFLITIVWLVLAFLPGIIELRRRKDVSPLRVVSESEVDIRHFAHNFRVLVDSEIDRLLAASRKDGQNRDGVLSDGSAYTVMGGGGPLTLADDERRNAYAERLLFSGGDLELPANMTYLGEIFSAGALAGGDRNIYRAVLTEGDMELGDESCSLRWLHAAGAVRAGEESAVYGRVSSDTLIQLAKDCCFERLHAPRIEFGSTSANSTGAGPPSVSEKDATLKKINPRDLPRVVELKAGRCLVLGNLEMPARSLFEENLVVKGQLKIGEGSMLMKSVKSGKDMILEDGVVVQGAAASGRALVLGRDCRIGGPLLAERKAKIGSGCMIGSEESPTTFSAEEVEMGAGSVAHGTVWAHGCGRVRGADESRKVQSA